MQFHFGEYVLDTDLGRLTGPGGNIVLRRQAWRLLVELLEQAPGLVERDALLDRVWGRSALSPNALPQTISELRQALGDQARQPKYIETCHGRGYRMICPVQRQVSDHCAADSGPDLSTARSQQAMSQRSNWPMPALLIGSLAAVVVLVWFWFEFEPSGPASSPASPALVETLLRQAKVAQARHDPQAAAAHWRALVLIDPDNQDWALAQAEAELDALQGDQARRSLALLATDSALRRHPQLMILRARLAEIDGKFEQAVQLAEAAVAQSHSLDLPYLVSQASRMQARAWKRQGELDRAAAAIQSVLDRADVGFSQKERLELTLQLSALRREQGRLSEARAALEMAQAGQGSAPLGKRLIIEKALIQVAEGAPRRAWDTLQALQARWPEDAGPETQLAFYSAVGQVAMEVGEIDQALAAFEQGFSLARSTGSAYQAAGLKINTGSLLARHDRFEEAERLWHDALDAFERIGDRRGEAIALGNLAAAASAQGYNTRSESLNRRALDLFRELELDGPRARTAFNLALVASREGRLDEAETLFFEAQDGYRRAGALELVLHVGANRVDHRILAGDLALAEHLLGELESISESGSDLRRAAILASRGRMEKWRGDLPAARRAFEAARSLRAQSGHAGWKATSELELLQLDLLEGNELWRVRVQALELAETFQRSDQLRAAARARLVAAEALLGQGERLEAWRELEQIRQGQHSFIDTSLALDLSWLEIWAAREEERMARLEALASRVLEYGYYGKLAQIEAGLAARGMSLNELNGLELLSELPASTTLVGLLPPHLAAIASTAGRN